jgi:type 1 fimbriae regulatory protein FimB/type 1 fimbriae regulatory protein FimE
MGQLKDSVMGDTSKIVDIKRARKGRKGAVNGTVQSVPNRKANDALRTRDYLLPSEVDLLVSQAKKSRNPKRDSTMVLMAFRHGLRVSELCDLQWSDIDFKAGTVHVRRLKGSSDSVHFLKADESRPLKALQKTSSTPYVFESERGSPITTAGFRKQFSRWGVQAGLPFPVNPHMLRHACGYALANKGMDTRSLQAYLGHKEIANTVRYTEMSASRFKGIWD